MTTHAAGVVYACPKCHGKMRSFERSGILIEQCEDCRGIFLDHGELERFVEAEGGGWSGRVGPPRPEWTPAGPARPRAATDRVASDRVASDRRASDEDRRDESDRRQRDELIAAIRDLFGDEP